MKYLLFVLLLGLSGMAISSHPNDIVPDALLYDYDKHTGITVGNSQQSVIIVDDSTNPHSDIGIPAALTWDN